MKVKDLMHKDPTCCTPNMKIQDVANLMIDCDCGAIPVVQHTDRRLVGIITDRDIVCRAVARGKNPGETAADECMSDAVATVGPDSTLEDCLQIMQLHQVRRLPVVDEDGFCVGMVTQAQIVRHGTQDQTAHLIKDVSRKTKSASAMASNR
jgi:CBS domain-containing protein